MKAAEGVILGEMRYLLCIYSCDREPYNRLRQSLLQEPWMQKIIHDPRVATFFVYADPHLREPQLRGNELFLPCQERYDHLAEKTWAMLRYFDARGGFDYLIKLDDSSLASPDARRLRKLPLLDLCRGHYRGCTARKTSPRGLRKWLEMKGLNADLRQFPWGTRFYLGKCYMLSREAVRTVSASGENYVQRFMRDYAGMEDVMVAVILQEHLLLFRDHVRLFLAAAMTKCRDVKARIAIARIAVNRVERRSS